MSRRGGLFWKYLIVLVALVSGALLVSGAIEIYFTYHENEAAILALQTEKAAAAASRIEAFMAEIEGQMGWTTQPQLVAREAALEQRRTDFIRLQRQVPPITELTFIDATGREQLTVSRLAMDVTGSQADVSHEPRFTEARKRTWYGPVTFRKDSEPYMTIAMPVANNAGVSAAEVNLKFIWDVVQKIKVGKSGHAFVLDAQGNLIAHRDISLVLQKTSLVDLPHVRAAIAPGAVAGVAADAQDRRGRKILAAYSVIPTLRWVVFVEQPSAEAFTPLRASITRVVVLGLIGVLGAVITSVLLVRRMVRPIHALQEGAARIGAGELGHHLEIQTGDELEALAGEFNRMTAQLQESYATLERRVEERTRELSESLEQQTATAEILRVISSSPTDVQPVFESIVRSVSRLCGGGYAFVIRLVDGDTRLVAHTGASPEWLAVAARYRWGASVTAVRERRVLHIPDLEDDHPYPGARELGRTMGYRSLMFVPMIREDHAVGAIGVTRTEAGGFTDKQIALLQTFADQAVIAIENVRLFTELQEKNRAITEALEQQTATAEILRVISSSPTDVQPVLETVADNAARVCGASDTQILLLSGDALELRAHHGPIRGFPVGERFSVHPGTVAGRAVLEARTVHLEDIWADDGPFAVEKMMALRFGHRTAVATALLREGAPIGVLLIRRMEVRPFTEKQIELLKTFADQAVIAIENVRLFTELQERTGDLARSVDQLTALGEVSRAVSSTLDLDLVLNTVVARATQLANADGCSIYEYDEQAEGFRVRVTSLTAELLETQRATVLRRGEGAVGKLAETREPVQIPDIADERAYRSPLRDVLLRDGYRALLAVPMIQEDRVVGGLVLSRRSPGEFPAETVELMKTFANQSTLAIENARLFSEIEDKGRELEVANRHKSEFLANMSHELRTPLNAVIGFSEVLVDRLFGELNEKQDEYLRDIYSSGRHLLSLINDILDLSKIEAGRMELEVTRFDLPQAVENALTLVRGRADAHAIRLDVDIDRRLGEFAGDERKFKQVMVNLLSNAVKFTPEGGRVAVRAGLANGSVEISVIDTGIGIAPEDQQAIFEEFRQVGTDYARKREGTGLGLALTKRFIELHGGEIWVKSAVGEGSTFTFTLPVRSWPTSSS